MERQTKGGRPAMPRYPSGQARGNPQTTRMAPKYMHTQQPFQFEVYQNQIRCTPLNVNTAAVAGRFPFPYPYYCPSPMYTNQPGTAAVLGNAGTPLHTLHHSSPMPFNSSPGGMPLHNPGGGSGSDVVLSQMSLQQNTPASAAAANNSHLAAAAVAAAASGMNPGALQQLSSVPNSGGPNPGGHLPPQHMTGHPGGHPGHPGHPHHRGPARRRSKAIEILDPNTMKPVHLGKEEGSTIEEVAPAPPPQTVTQPPKKIVLSAPPPVDSPRVSSGIVITAPHSSTPITISAPPPPQPSSSSSIVVSPPPTAVPDNNNNHPEPPKPAAPALVVVPLVPTAPKEKGEDIVVVPSSTITESSGSSQQQPAEEVVVAVAVEEEKKPMAAPQVVAPPLDVVREKQPAVEQEEAKPQRMSSQEPAPLPAQQPIVAAIREMEVPARPPPAPLVCPPPLVPSSSSTSSDVLKKEEIIPQPTPPIKKDEEVIIPVPAPHVVEAVPEAEPKKAPSPDVSGETTSTTGQESLAEEESVSPGPSVAESEEDIDEEDDIEDDESSSASKTPYTLLYDYKPDQWSPLNPNGKRQYDSAFLKQLQSSPLCLSKPDTLPDLEIIRDSPIKARMSGSGGSSDMTDFMPNFSASHGGSLVKSSSRNSLSKRSSRDGRVPRPGGPNVGGSGGGYVLSGARSLSGALPERVELRTTENPWRPSKDKPIEAVRGIVPDNSTPDTLEEQRKKVMAILNKLTPQKFDSLLGTFNNLKIDSEEKLRQAIDLIFEKAIDEPNYSVAYARMCEVLQTKTVADSKFKTLIITKCQNEFEKSYMPPEEKLKFKQDLEAAKTESEKKAIKEEFGARELRARRRSLGNVRFIGEIYKRKLLSIKIMHGCIHHLLKAGDEESLESLCRLLTTVGKQIETDTQLIIKNSKNDSRKDSCVLSLDKYFSLISDMVENRPASKDSPAITNRTKFMLQDMIDLRKRDWVPRRDVAGPKTLDQIHQDVAREKKAQALNNLNQSMSRHESGGGGGGRNNSGRSSSMMSSKRSFRSGNNFSNGGGGGGGGNHSSEDGWSTDRVKKNNPEGLDMDYVRNINNKSTNFDNMKFVPNSSRASWGKGASASGSRGSMKGSLGGSSGEPPLLRSSNRFSSFSIESERNEGSSGSGGSSSISKSISLNRNGRSNMDRDFRSSDGASRSGGGMSRSMRSTPGAGDMMRGSAGGSSMGGSAQSSASKLYGPPNLDKDTVVEEASNIFKAYVRNNNMDEAMSTIKGKMHANCMKDFVEALIDKELESPASRREFLNLFIERLMKEDILSTSDCKEVISSFYTLAPDYISDIPKFWECFISIIACLFVPSGGSRVGFLPLSVILEYLPGDSSSSSSKMGHDFVSTSLLHLSRSSLGKEGLSEMFHSSLATSQSQISSSSSSRNSSSSHPPLCLSSPAVEKLLENDDLAFLKNPPSSSISTSNSGGGGAPSGEAAAALKREIKGFFNAKATNEDICDWINNSVGKERASESGFIRSLTMECIRSAITLPQTELDIYELDDRIPLIEKALGNDSEKQLQALFAIQKLVKDLTYPPGLMASLFFKFFEADVIKDDVFRKWKDDTAECEGKGICMSALTRFFKAIDN